MPTETVSVVVPCHNAERWIAATLASVFGQAGAQLDVIVVDDGSRDASPEVVAREFPQARLLRQTNAGVAAARNAGVAAARGDWVAFVDADDIWLPAKLTTQLSALAARPDYGMVCSGWEVWPSDRPEPDPALVERLVAEPVSEARWGGPSGWIYPQLLLDSQVWTSTVVLRRALLERVGGFDTSLRIGEDLDLWLRLSRETPILRIARPLALYRKHPASITRAVPTENWQGRVIEQALRRWGYRSPDGAQADPRAIRRTLARTWRDFAAAQFAAGNRAGALAGAVNALRHDWGQAGNWRLLVRSLFATPSRPGAVR